MATVCVWFVVAESQSLFVLVAQAAELQQRKAEREAERKRRKAEQDANVERKRAVLGACASLTHPICRSDP